MLKGKLSLITGGSRGIGKAIASLFFEQGSSVVIFGTDEAKGQQAVTDIQNLKHDSSQTIQFLIVDVSNTKAVEVAINKILDQFGRIDILVNNAGITRDQLLMKMSEEDWDRVLAVNLKSVYNTCRVLCRSMMKARFGSIINISSVVGLMGNPGQVNYAASKAGMIGFTKSLAKELASRNIRVNCIAPGYVETQMTEGLTESLRGQLMEKIPLKRIGRPEDIAHAALYLASNLSSYVTGQVISVDGGMVM